MPSLEAIRERVLIEARQAGERGWAFETWWLSAVCRNRERQAFITGEMFGAAKAAWQRGTAQQANRRDASSRNRGQG